MGRGRRFESTGTEHQVMMWRGAYRKRYGLPDVRQSQSREASPCQQQSRPRAHDMRDGNVHQQRALVNVAEQALCSEERAASETKLRFRASTKHSRKPWSITNVTTGREILVWTSLADD